ncbi:MAG TPA: tryptophan-rich sensory protein [Myxococcaceae bacterium]|nr:tryptophan-rich sensory protein [Myxococcaceae bacterium]
MTSRWSRWTTLLVTFAGIGLPWLFARKALDSNDPAAQAVAFLPAPYAFIIWAPIYTGFLIFAVWQARSDRADNPRVAAIRPWLMLSAVLNAAWIGAVALHRPGWTVPIIFLMLAVAITMHRVGRIGDAVVTDPAEAWLRLPFSLYAGWLVVATFVNVSTELARVGWDGFGWSPVTWGILMIVVSSIVGLSTRFRLDDPVLGAVFVWAYLAIVVQQQERPLVSLFAGLAAALCLLSLFVRDRRAPHSTRSECAEV